jgi:hypothetical protein
MVCYEINVHVLYIISCSSVAMLAQSNTSGAMPSTGSAFNSVSGSELSFQMYVVISFILLYN